MRMTNNRRHVLLALQNREFQQWGTPPYGAATVAHILQAPNVNNVARTLRQLASAGFVVRVEGHPVPVWSEVQGRCHERKQAGYWNASIKIADQQAAVQWQQGASARQEAALNRMVALWRS